MRPYLNFSTQFLLLVVASVIYITACNPPKENGYVSTRDLNTGKMIEADSSLIDTSTSGPGILAVYLHDTTKRAKNDTVPAVDVFICISHKRDAVLGDTIVIFDTQLRGKIPMSIENYWTQLHYTKQWLNCKVPVSAKELGNIKRYKYKYANITLVTDD